MSANQVISNQVITLLKIKNRLTILNRKKIPFFFYFKLKILSRKELSKLYRCSLNERNFILVHYTKFQDICKIPNINSYSTK